MVLNHLWGLLSHPDQEWESIRNEPNTLSRHYLAHTVILAAIPAVCGYIGATQIGWRIGDDPTIHLLTPESALQLCTLFYLAMITGVFVLGKFIDFLSITYQGDDHTARGVALASYTSTPLFVVGVIALFPVLWVNMLVAMLAIAYTVFLLYEGIPILMKIPSERGFMFASSVVTVGLVMLVGMMAITVIIWAVGVGPVFTTQPG
jgi:hypothetical protein